MNSSVLELLQCPICESTSLASKVLQGCASDIEVGIVWCENRHWFPIEDRVLEFLPPDLQYQNDRERFQQKHDTELAASGLASTGASPAAAICREELGLIQTQQH